MGTELHDLQPPEGARRPKTRVGRGIGSGRGKTSTRGMKGQLARRTSMKASFEGGQLPIHRRVPKRGFVNIHRVEVTGVNVGRLEGVFAKGEEINLESLHAKGLVPKKAKIIKLLAGGEIKTALTVKVHRISKAAQAKVEAAGGTVELIAKKKAAAGDDAKS